MSKCPYCNNEMQKRIIEADGRNPLICIEKDKERTMLNKLRNNDAIILDTAKIINKAAVECEYCTVCKKIIIDVNNKHL